LPVTGVIVAVVVTTALDASGRTAFSALPLLPLTGALWCVERVSRRDVGLVWGRARDYGLAALYPALVLGSVFLIAVVFGGAHADAASWGKAATRFAIVAVGTFIGALLTEEAFFRGWLWASLRRRGLGPGKVLLWTSAAFALWHLSYATLAEGYTLPPLGVLVFILNAAVLGAIWGCMRSMSGSIVVSSVSHALWNGGAYAFFGEGPTAGVLGLPNTIVFGPEIGIVGLAANVLFLAAIHRASGNFLRTPVSPRDP
jgi:membrane protease YdiL (CAAX protease family)